MRVLAVLQQFRRAGERVGNAQRRGRITEVFRFVFVDDEAAADGVVHVARQRRILGVECPEAHAVAVEEQRLVDAEAQMLGFAERDGMPARDRQQLLRADPLDFGADLVRIDAIGRLAGQAEQHGAVGAVSAAGQRERPVQVDDDARRALELPAGLQLLREAEGGAHRTHGVRTRRPEADLEQIESADEHLMLQGRSCVGVRISGCVNAVLDSSIVTREHR